MWHAGSSCLRSGSVRCPINHGCSLSGQPCGTAKTGGQWDERGRIELTRKFLKNYILPLCSHHHDETRYAIDDRFYNISAVIWKFSSRNWINSPGNRWTRPSNSTCNIRILKVVFVTSQAAELKEMLINNSPSPINIRLPNGKYFEGRSGDQHFPLQIKQIMLPFFQSRKCLNNSQKKASAAAWRGLFLKALQTFFYILHQPNNFWAFEPVISLISWRSIPWISASFKATYWTKAGSFLFPRLGTGVKNGESVSSNRRETGIDFTISSSE